MLPDHYEFLKKSLKDEFKTEFLFRASDNGYRYEDMINYCLNKEQTIVIIKTDNGMLFGCYNMVKWVLKKGY